MFTKFVNKLPLFLRSHEKPDPCNFAGKIDMPSKPTESHHFMKKKNYHIMSKEFQSGIQHDVTERKQ